MRLKNYELEIEVPEGVEVSLDNTLLTVKGEKGEIKRDFFDPQVNIVHNDNNIVLKADVLTKKEKRRLNTYAAHIRNMFHGVKEGYTYKLKICSGHFPINASVKGNEFVIKNYVGEKEPRILKFDPEVTVKVDGEIVTVESNDIEKAGQVSGSIERLGSRPGFDKRIFQQGIFITEKPRK